MWARPNKGVDTRALRDIESEIASKRTYDSARAALERKAQIYEKLRKGKSGGLNDAQVDALLVDVCTIFIVNMGTLIISQFDAKNPNGYYESDSDDVDESLTVPERPDKNVCLYTASSMYILTETITG